jgi:cell division protein FtsW
MLKRLTALFTADKRPVDYVFLTLLLSLIVVGLFIFFSASLQSLGQAKWNSLMVRQIGYSLVIGGTLLFAFSRFQYKALAPWGLGLLITAFGLSLLVFIPGLGMTHGGGQRWLDLGIINVQPGEFLKFASVVFFAVWFAKWKRKLDDWRFGLLPLVVSTSAIGVLLFLQKDIGTLVIISATIFFMFLVSNAPRKHILLVFMCGICLASAAAVFVPHVRQRVMTFISLEDPQGTGWQVRQSLIAVGSGGLVGKGYLQSVQRFNYLPEAHGDSIFAVASEEFGFIGSSILVAMYVLFALRAYKIANKAPDDFSMLLATGFTSMIIVQSFLNIGSVINIIPFTGEPLVFISQGGTALVIAMSASGIILNISQKEL